MVKITGKLFLLLPVLFLLLVCDASDAENPGITDTSTTTDASVENKIFEFQVEGICPYISDNLNRIILHLPYMTDITALKPIISISDGASIEPASDTIQDFTFETLYTVIAENGDQAIYAVDISAEDEHVPFSNPGPPYYFDVWQEDNIWKGGAITLDGSGSTEPDIASGDSIVSYEWWLIINDSSIVSFHDYGVYKVPKPTIYFSTLSSMINSTGYHLQDLIITDPQKKYPTLQIQLTVTDTTK